MEKKLVGKCVGKIRINFLFEFHQNDSEIIYKKRNFHKDSVIAWNPSQEIRLLQGWQMIKRN